MYARVARFEGADAESLKAATDQIRSQGEEAGGPPEGVPSTGFLLLRDPDGGKALAIGFFETEEDYAEGDATLNSMTPPGDGMGQRVGVDKYEVAAKFEAEA